MLSFINIMGGKNPLDDPENEENSEGKKKVEVKGFMSWQDALVLIVIIAAIVGGYQYYKYTKKQSAEVFARCALQYDGGDFVAAKACYESTWDLSYAPADLDSLRVIRLGGIEDMKIAQEAVLSAVVFALEQNDTIRAMEEAKKFVGPILLDNEDSAKWSEVLSTLK